MKKFFRLVSMLAIAGLTLTYTSCTDYSEDIDKTNGRIDDLENVKLPDLQKQIDANKQSIADLNTAIAEANKAIDALEAQVGKLDETHKADIERLETLISTLQENVNSLTGRVNDLEGLKDTYLTKDDAKATYATISEVANVKGDVSQLQEGLKTAKSEIENLGNKHDKDIEAVKKLIEKAQTAADNAQKRADDAFEEIDALKEALKQYVKQGAFDEQVKLLKDKDTELENSIKTNKEAFDDFAAAFDENVKELIKESCENADGKINQTITTKIEVAVQNLESKISSLRTEVNNEFVKVWNIINGELRSLVFIPELVVDGVKAVEYSYAEIHYLTAGTAADKSLDGFTLKNYVEYGETDNTEYIYPAATVWYEMNPSGATVTENTPLVFLTKDVRSISTKAAAPSAFNAEFVKTENGNLAVSLDPAIFRHFSEESDSVTLFALQATVKAKEKDEDAEVTVTSDYARIYATQFELKNIAFNDANKQYDVKTDDAKCDHVEGERHHVYRTPEEALVDTAYIKVGFEDTFDFNGKFESHYVATVTATKAVKGVYDGSEFAGSSPVTYEFDLINYTVDDVNAGGNVTLVGGKLAASGKADIDMQPLVRVRAIINGKTVLVGFVKVKITSDRYFFVDPALQFSTKVGCNDFVESADADDMNRIYSTLDFTDEALFDAQYQLYVDEQGEAVRYKIVDGKPVADESPLGTVKDNSETVSKLVVNLTNKEVGRIFQAEGSYTTYVRYIRAKEGAPVDEYEGVYVPVTVTVTRDEAGTVGTKLANYWFDNDKAYLNVAVPGTYSGPLKNMWVTPINQVWDGNLPVFAVNDAPVTGKYYYYFAPEQTELKDSEGTVVYTLSVKNKTIKDKASGQVHDVTNAGITDLESKIMADMGSKRSIYANDELLANGVAIAKIVNYDAEGKDVHSIEFYNTPLALEVLNFTASNPKEESKLFANIGVALSDKCGVAVPLADQVNKYYFLRPINFEGSNENTFVDGDDATDAETTINILDAVKFTDWRGRAFVTEDYKNLWYFAYYGVNRVTVDLDNVTTDLNEHELANTKLSEVTSKVNLYFNGNDATTPNSRTIEYASGADPANWNASNYPYLVEKFGAIHYVNNGANVSKQFKLRIPVKISYTWGEIVQKIDITVNPTKQN